MSRKWRLKPAWVFPYDNQRPVYAWALFNPEGVLKSYWRIDCPWGAIINHTRWHLHRSGHTGTVRQRQGRPVPVGPDHPAAAPAGRVDNTVPAKIDAS